MSVINATPLLAAAGGEYEISRSVRLRSSASAYFNRTPASASNRNTWTWSAWVKRGALGSGQTVFAAYPSSTVYAYIGFTSSDQIRYASTNSGASLTTTAVYRDPSAWYHIVFVYDDTQATSSNRLKLYVNGVQVTAFGTASYPTLNFGDYINSANVHNLGRFPSGTEYTDGYLTEVNFIDGQALTPSSFGETDAVTGVWKPKKYAGTYGTNGFYLNFSDNSAATAAAIGKDSSGNGNNWTPNNISVTSGVTYDSMIDVPTMYADGGNGRGNYPTLNPLFNTGILGYLPLTNANLTATDTSGSAAWRSRWATIGMSSGKWYAEFPITYSGSASVSSAGAIGIGLHDGGSSATYVGQTSTTYGYLANAVRYNNASSVSYGATFANGDVIGVAYDADAGTLTFYKNGVSQGVAYSSIPAGTYFFAVSVYWVSPDGNTTINANFGQRPFAYTPPTGFKALNTQNLPDATIKKGNQFFDVSTWTGNGTSQSIVNSGAMQPDLVWAKQRSSTQWHRLIDAVRGTDKVLYSNDTTSEFTDNTQLTSFNSNGFSVGSQAGFNANAATYVGWQWKESASAGFDIVTQTLGTTGINTMSHSLGVAPKMILAKRRDATEQWLVYHASGTTQSQYLGLNTTAAVASSANLWGSSALSSSQFYFSGTSGTQYLFYLFSEVAGYSKFGSYTGNGSADGPFVFCGFRPRFVMVKRTDSTENWYIHDSARDTYNQVNAVLFPNLSNAEGASNANMDFTSNGFKIRENGTASNASGGTYIFMALAENPFKNSLAR